MRFGLCTDLKNAPLVARLGYDYIEPPLNKTTAMSDEEFALALEGLQSSGIKAECCALMFPKDLVVVGKQYNEEEMVAYLRKAFNRMNQMGATVVVFGSGKSRFVPNEMSYGDAFRFLVEVTKRIVSVAKEYAIIVVIEPLNQGETNLINTLTEADALASLSGASLLVDGFHLRKEGEEVAHIKLCQRVAHAHIATLEGRRYPLKKDEELVFFIKALKESGYDGRLSIEGKSEDMEKDSLTALKLLRDVSKEV